MVFGALGVFSWESPLVYFYRSVKLQTFGPTKVTQRWVIVSIDSAGVVTDVAFGLGGTN